MSTILDNFLAARAKRQPVTNDAQPVTRAEFNKLTVAVAALIEDVETALSPEQLGKALNAALEPLVNRAAPTKPGTPRTASRYLLPADDDDDAGDGKPVTTANSRYKLPEGD